MPLFSVIVPIYNVESYIRKCIESIIQQTFKDMEIILVDDGSTDNCPKICEDYVQKDKRIKVVHKINGGLVSARQAGVAVAMGEYVACVDGDDWIAPDFLQKFAEVINKYHVDVACCGHVVASSTNQNPIPMKYKGFYSRQDMEEKIFPCLIHAENGECFPNNLCGKVFRRNIYQPQQLCVSTRFTIGEDTACSKPTIYHSSSMYCMQDCLYYYRYNQESSTKKKKPFFWDGPEIIGRHLERQIDITKFDFDVQIKRMVVHSLFNVCYTQFYSNKSYINVIKSIESHVYNNEYYVDCIDKCIYKNSIKHKMALFSLKYRLFFLMYIYSIIKFYYFL